MGKIYCTECGSEMEDTDQFCPNCGTKVDDEIIAYDSNENTDNVSRQNSVKIRQPPKNNSSNNTKIFLAIGIACIILAIIGIALIGSSVNNSSNDANINQDNSEEPYIENIYGIGFSIPGYFKKAESKDYEDEGNGAISCTRTYERPDGTGIAIMVVTSPEGWNLNNVDGTYMTVNGHQGKLSSARDVFGYPQGDKLVIISGTSQEEVEKIII